MASRKHRYEAKAAECLWRATGTADPTAKATFLELAAQWRDLADQVDDFEQSKKAMSQNQ